MFGMRYAESSDREFWYTLDKHLPETEFEKKVRDRMGYIILEDNKPVGVMRYHLFWDNTPFLTLLFIDRAYQKKGCGRRAVECWEQEMKQKGYGMVMVSTQVDEGAQHFYRKLGYRDCGCLVMELPGYEQPMEMFMAKSVMV